MRILAASALLLVLGACAPISLPKFDMKAPPPSAPAEVKPVCTAAMKADLVARPDPPKGAGFPKPQSPEGSAAVALYLPWLKAFSDHDRLGWSRLAEIKAYCDAVKP